ncbi:MAG: hypothetical protein V4714_04970 [Bacteroidota bacterium]
MKKIFSFFLLTALLATFVQAAYAQQVLPGSQGIWVLCGNELAENLHYSIFRKTASSDWQAIATLNKPGSAAEIKARMLEVWKQGFAETKELTDFELRYVWRQVKNNRADSLSYYSTNYPVLQGAGLAFYDATAQKDTEYSYRIVKASKDKTLSEKTADRVRFPGQGPEVGFFLKSKKALAAGITLAYTFSKTPNLAGVRVYRGYYMRTGYELIKPDLFFSGENDSTKLLISDKTASPKVAYSYYLEPFDAAGNSGKPAGHVSLYNVQKNTISPSVNRIQTRSDEKEKAIRLSWRLANYADVVSIEVYRSSNYDGPYRRVSSLRPNDTLYLDSEVKPIETYYYSVVLNGMFETSIQSARVPGMLKASSPNLTPINHFTLVQQNNVVTLEWDKAETDTRGYYLYRAEGYNQPLRQIKGIILTDSVHVRLIDTLPASTENKLYQYAIRDVNTSYALGPFSSRRNATVYGLNRLPMPNKMEIVKQGYNQVRVIWQNLQHVNTVSGYVLYRRETVGEDDINSAFKEIRKFTPTLNQFVDSNLVIGKTYVYGVRSVGSDSKDLSSISPLARFTVIAEDVPQADNIQVFFSSGKVNLRWQNPVGIVLKNVEIFRAEKGSAIAKLVALSSDTEAFEDSRITAGKTYYYYLKVIDSQGLESRMEGPIGIVAE